MDIFKEYIKLKNKILGEVLVIRLVLAILFRHFLALFFVDSITLLLILVVGLGHWHLLAHLLRLVVGYLLVLGGAFFLILCLALFFRYILTLLLGNLDAFLPVHQGALLVGNLLAHFPLLLVAHFGRH